MVATVTSVLSLDELDRRAGKAAEYCYEAIEARDWDKFIRALTRLIERWVQWNELHWQMLVEEYGADGDPTVPLTRLADRDQCRWNELFPCLKNREITAGDLLRAAGQVDAPILVIAAIDATWFRLTQRLEYGEDVPPEAGAFARERIVSGYSEEVATILIDDKVVMLHAESPKIGHEIDRV